MTDIEVGRKWHDVLAIDLAGQDRKQESEAPRARGVTPFVCQIDRSPMERVCCTYTYIHSQAGNLV